MMTTPNFNDLTPPPHLADDVSDGVMRLSTALDAAARWGARHGYEQARQLWPEPITSRPPTEADADSFEDVQVLTSAGRWRVAHWSSAQTSPWLHTPRWPPRQPTLQEQALSAVAKLSKKYPCFEGAALELVRRALEQAGEGVEHE